MISTNTIVKFTMLYLISIPQKRVALQVSLTAPSAKSAGWHIINHPGAMNCIRNAYLHYYAPKYPVVADIDDGWLLPAMQDTWCNHSYIHYPQSVIIQPPPGAYNYLYLKNYFLDFYNVTHLAAKLNRLDTSGQLNNLAKFVLVADFFATASTPTLSNPLILNSVTELIMRYEMYKTVLISIARNGDAQVHAWFRYNDEFVQPLDVDAYCDCDGGGDGGFRALHGGVSTRANGATVKLRTAVWPPFINNPVIKVEDTADRYLLNEGLEVKLMNTIGPAANITVEYYLGDADADFGNVYENGTSTLNFIFVENKTNDAVLCSAIATLARQMFYLISEYYYEDADDFCVPAAAKLPEWHKITKLLSMYVWVLLAAVIMIVVIYITKVKVLSEEIDYYNSLSNCVINVVAIIARNPITEPTTWTLRYIFTCWITFMLILNIFCECYMMSILHITIYDKQVIDLEGVIEQNYKVMFMENYKRYFDQNTGPHGTEIRARIRNCADIRVCMRQMAFNRDTAMCLQRSYFRYRSTQYLDADSRSLIYCFGKGLSTNRIVTIFRRGFHLTETINHYIVLVREAGLPDKWIADIFNERLRSYFNAIDHTSMTLKGTVATSTTTTSTATDATVEVEADVASAHEDAEHPLTMAHLQAIFYAYAVAVLLSVLIFVVEISYFKFNHNNNNNGGRT